MHADMEIHSAAKLPTRHLRCADETGARSALKSGLVLSSSSSADVRSDWVEFIIGSIASVGDGLSKVRKHQKNQALLRSACVCETVVPPAELGDGFPYVRSNSRTPTVPFEPL